MSDRLFDTSVLLDIATADAHWAQSDVAVLRLSARK